MARKRSTIARGVPFDLRPEDDEVVAPVVDALAAQRLGAAGALGAGLDAEEALQHVVLDLREVVEQEDAHALGAQRAARRRRAPRGAAQ